MMGYASLPVVIGESNCDHCGIDMFVVICSMTSVGRRAGFL